MADRPDRGGRVRARRLKVVRVLALLGVENLRRWATLSLFVGIDTKPRELTATALLRARFCELAGAGLPETTSAERFTLGLFSVIDALIDSPIEEILSSTPFPVAMRKALATRRGTLGRRLECVLHLEAGRPTPPSSSFPERARSISTPSCGQPRRGRRCSTTRPRRRPPCEPFRRR